MREPAHDEAQRAVRRVADAVLSGYAPGGAELTVAGDGTTVADAGLATSRIPAAGIRLSESLATSHEQRAADARTLSRYWSAEAGVEHRRGLRPRRHRERDRRSRLCANLTRMRRFEERASLARQESESWPEQAAQVRAEAHARDAPQTRRARPRIPSVRPKEQSIGDAPASLPAAHLRRLQVEPHDLAAPGPAGDAHLILGVTIVARRARPMVFNADSAIRQVRSRRRSPSRGGGALPLRRCLWTVFPRCVNWTAAPTEGGRSSRRSASISSSARGASGRPSRAVM